MEKRILLALSFATAVLLSASFGMIYLANQKSKKPAPPPSSSQAAPSPTETPSTTSTTQVTASPEHHTDKTLLAAPAAGDRPTLPHTEEPVNHPGAPLAAAPVANPSATNSSTTANSIVSPTPTASSKSNGRDYLALSRANTSSVQDAKTATADVVPTVPEVPTIPEDVEAEETKPTEAPPTPTTEATPAPKPPFTAYSALAFHRLSRPAQRPELLPRISVFYAGQFFLPDSDRVEPDEHVVRFSASRHPPGEIVVLDIEHWPLGINTPDDKIEESIDKMLKVVRWIREENPTLLLGYYSMVPYRSYWAAIDGPESESYQRWEAHNNRLQRLAAELDYLFPSLYTFYDDPAGWITYAEGNLEQARRFNKPVIPFLWFEYHDSTERAGQQIDAKYWAMQLEWCKKNADGLVIWGGYQRTFDPGAPWWTTTVRFLENSNYPPAGD